MKKVIANRGYCIDGLPVEMQEAVIGQLYMDGGVKAVLLVRLLSNCWNNVCNVVPIIKHKINFFNKYVGVKDECQNEEIRLEIGDLIEAEVVGYFENRIPIGERRDLKVLFIRKEYSNYGYELLIYELLKKTEYNDSERQFLKDLLNCVETLDLDENPLSVDAAKRLAKALAGNSTLRELFLGHSHIEVDGASAVVKALEGNSTLQELNLGANKIGYEGANVVADVLKGNRSLQFLNVYGCGIGNEGASAVSGLLEGNTTLTTLDLAHNGIGDEGASALAKALEGNSTLRELNLGYNEIGDAAQQQLIAVAGPHLTIVDLGFVDLGFVDLGFVDLGFVSW